MKMMNRASEISAVRMTFASNNPSASFFVMPALNCSSDALIGFLMLSGSGK